MTAKNLYIISASSLFILNIILCLVSLDYAWYFILTGTYVAIGIHDLFLSSHNILKNYPVIGHFRYLFESIRPEMQQYLVASNLSETPFNRETRSLVYQRSKKANDTVPFGTQRNIMEEGYEFIHHSLSPKVAIEGSDRVMIGNEQCQKPYSASRLNVSAMSFGALGDTAIEALNRGAKLGNFSQCTGEGGLTPYHLKYGGDLILQIGTAYFGFRNEDGSFCEEKFQEKALLDNVKMIEIKLSQGAKPSHGGLLPAVKISKEISEIRGIPQGKDCFSPATHTAFNSPKTLMDFIQKVRQLCGGKPVGFKIAIGKRSEFMGICKAMVEEKVYPDFITIDGAEGGTGAAPIEFSNRLGLPINEALIFVHNCLVGINLRDKIKIIAAGKVASAFDVLAKLAIGADACNQARAFLFSIGCIQSRRCNTNECPTGIATQDKTRTGAVEPIHKSEHVYNYHQTTMESFLELMGAIGIDSPEKLTPDLIQKRVSGTDVKNYAELYSFIDPGSLLTDKVPLAYQKDWEMAKSEQF